MPKETASDAPRPLLPFMTEFNGAQPDVPEAERQAVKQAFEGLIADMFATHSDEVISVVKETVLFLKTPEYGVGDAWSLGIEKYDYDTSPLVAQLKFPPEEVIRSKIALSKHQGRKPLESYDYRLCGDGVVRRYDYGSMSEWIKFLRTSDTERKIIGGMLLGKPPTTKEREELARPDPQQKSKHMEGRLMLENQRAERGMRLNNFPITMAEMEGLRSWIQTRPFEGMV